MGRECKRSAHFNAPSKDDLGRIPGEGLPTVLGMIFRRLATPFGTITGGGAKKAAGCTEAMIAKEKRVLLVEDSDDGRFALAKLLQLEGYAILEATDGAQAIAMAAQERPDLILMDLSLPVIDGLTATRTIRKTAGMEHVPIIALSGHDAIGLGKDAKEAGITDYATKPVDFDLLINMLSRYLSESGSSD